MANCRGGCFTWLVAFVNFAENECCYQTMRFAFLQHFFQWLRSEEGWMPHLSNKWVLVCCSDQTQSIRNAFCAVHSHGVSLDAPKKVPHAPFSTQQIENLHHCRVFIFDSITPIDSRSLCSVFYVSSLASNAFSQWEDFQLLLVHVFMSMISHHLS